MKTAATDASVPTTNHQPPTTGFTEPFPTIVSPQPGGVDDPLGESVLDLEQPWLRVFEPRDVRLVLGRNQDPHRELLVEQAQVDAVPIHRRVAGGGAVVLAPGMVVVAARLASDGYGTDCYFDLVNRALRPAVAACAGVEPLCRGHGDLTMPGADGRPRKILGASLRQTSRLAVYLGVLLVDDVVPLMERYLQAPSRQPDYRQDRGHRDFCTHLGAYGVTATALIAAIERSCAAVLVPHALIQAS
jgi:lipoate-protein ligase A